jgi:4-carboxymuconolactone decarboxylase
MTIEDRALPESEGLTAAWVAVSGDAGELSPVAPDRSHQETCEQGHAIRRQVLGADYVDRARAAVSAFSQPIQDLTTEYCWGVVWSRDGLERKTRSLLNLAMLTALNRQHEFKAHVRGALTNGATVEEIQETLLQAAIYVGIPAGLESFRLAESVFKELSGDA